MDFQNGHANGTASYHRSLHENRAALHPGRMDRHILPNHAHNINAKLPPPVFFRIFSFLDLTSLCRCASVCRLWKDLVRDGANWQHVDLFQFQMNIEGPVVENLSRRAGSFLKSLNLKGCKNVGDNAIRIFAKHCYQIEVLNLCNCRNITDGACAALGRHAKKLKSLNLDSCDQVTDNSLNALGNGCQDLEHIDISWNTFITEAGFDYLTAGCPKLTRLVCKGVTNLNDTCLALCGERLPSLRIVKLQKCLLYTNEGVARLTEGCPNITSLSLSQNPTVSDLSLAAIGENCPEIRTLELSCCTHVTDQGFYQLTRNRPEGVEWHPLEYLDVEECNHLTDATLQNFASNCPNLKELILSHCDLITNDGIRALASSPQVHMSLRKIKLDNCPQVTDDALNDLCNCPSLTEIDLYDCQLITRNGISQMRSRLPHIKVHAYFAPSTPPLTEHRRRGGGRVGRFRSMCSCGVL